MMEPQQRAALGRQAHSSILGGQRRRTTLVSSHRRQDRTARPSKGPCSRWPLVSEGTASCLHGLHVDGGFLDGSGHASGVRERHETAEIGIEAESNCPIIITGNERP